MIKMMLKNTDWAILIITIALFVFGIIGIYSAGYNTESNQNEYIKQLIWLGISMVVVAAIYFMDSKFFEIIGYVVYVIGIILLVMVLFTTKVMGASSWFNIGDTVFVQPSEIMKIGYILCLSKVLSKYKGGNLSRKELILKWVKIGLLFLLPVTLILLQPDFGTAVTFLIITAFMLFISGIKYRYVLLIIFAILLIIPLIYNFMLNDTQKERIKVFLNPELDPLGSGYNAIQSKLAVGSGMLFGSGILNGTQTQYGYLPIKSSDFIFAVISEEMGFVASCAIIVLFMLLVIRILKVYSSSNELYHKYISVGIAGMIFYHFIQNIGMTFGALPITGVPLPFVSYGGSNLLTNYIGIAIILNITARKEKNFLFK
ncbi:MAG: rod shape-determining protein RodA [Clostridia bacterium]|nr:rod shape-determining protein RodA [Clostridia bacterium]